MEKLIPNIRVSITFERNPDQQLIKVNTPRDLYNIMHRLFDVHTIEWTEELIMLCFNKNDEIIGFYKLSKGGTAATVADPKVIYTIALNTTASSIAIAHNHPSGSLKPSAQDKALTKRIKHAGKLLDIQLLDHLIISCDGYYSFSDHGLI